MFELFYSWPWWIFAIGGMLCSTTYGVLVKSIDKRSHASVFCIVFAGFSAFVMGILCLALLLKGAHLNYSAYGVFMGMIAGAGFCIVDIQTVAMFRAGAPISLGISVIRASVAATGAIVGFLLFHETLDLLKTIGIVCASTGIFLLCYKKPEKNKAEAVSAE